jgi:ribosomal protein S18 acetylase RimI-like enzyme
MIEIREYDKEVESRYQLLQILRNVDEDFYPSLSKRKSLYFWLNLFEKGTILYASVKNNIVGFLAYYPSLSGDILDELMSCVNISPILSNSDMNYTDAYLHFIAISPGFRNNGISSLLMNRLFEKLQIKNISKIRVITWSTNDKSLNLYRKHGFQVFNTAFNDRGEGVNSVYLEAKVPILLKTLMVRSR